MVEKIVAALCGLALSANIAGAASPCGSEALEERVHLFKHYVSEAQRMHRASYKIDVEVLECSDERYRDLGGGPAGTFSIRDEDARPVAFTLVVSKYFLDKPDILLEHCARHEVAHPMNDDLQGYNRNGMNVEAAEEHRVLKLVGPERYREYITAYYEHVKKLNVDIDTFIKIVEQAVPEPMPSEIDEADKMAARYFREHDDGKEHILAYNGELHDVTLRSHIGMGASEAFHDPAILAQLGKEGKAITFFHKHPSGHLDSFPSPLDYGGASLMAFDVWKHNPEVELTSGS